MENLFFLKEFIEEALIDEARRKRKKKKKKTKHHPNYSAPEGSKRDKQLDATKADLASGDPKRIQRAYKRREKMEKKARKSPGWKNKPRHDSKK
tara:strand:+ start:2906 stop:3187 length:282 start_codon:yes stop_codon:yes gene_type:complete